MTIKFSLVVGTPDLGPWPFQLLTGTFDEKIRKTAEMGYHGIELICSDIDLVDRSMVKRTLETYGVDCPAFITGAVYGINQICLMSPDKDIELRGMQQLKGFLELALGSPNPLFSATWINLSNLNPASL